MASICDNINKLKTELLPYKATLVAVSKTKPVGLIRESLDCGQIIFGENYVQELRDKQPLLSDSTQWHMIGHLQSNKVKYVAPFINLIHTVDSLKLLEEINRLGIKNRRIINVLVQVFIADEDSKSGITYSEADELWTSPVLNTLSHVSIQGLMGMATNTEDSQKIRNEFKRLKLYFDDIKQSQIFQGEKHRMSTLSMGMSSDYKIALDEGSSMVRIGSLI